MIQEVMRLMNIFTERFEYTDGEYVINNIDYLDHPVVFVSWYGANHFALYNGYSLPTFDQWIEMVEVLHILGGLGRRVVVTII